jgi:hypothetical protein
MPDGEERERDQAADGDVKGAQDNRRIVSNSRFANDARKVIVQAKSAIAKAKDRR